MNLKEVIKTLELAKAEVEWDYPMDYAVAIDEAIKALDKQIPFKPETNNLKVGLGRCKCGAEFLDKLTNYCGNCGQRILWEVEE